MESVILVGHAEQDGDCFDLKIGPWSGRIGMMVKHANHLGTTETGAGLWDSVEKAKSVASQIVHKGLGTGCQISWQEVLD
jgi:hypothetical protein